MQQTKCIYEVVQSEEAEIMAKSLGKNDCVIVIEEVNKIDSYNPYQLTIIKACAIISTVALMTNVLISSLSYRYDVGDSFGRIRMANMKC